MGAVLVDPGGVPVTAEQALHDWRLVQPFPAKRWPRVWVWMEPIRHRVMDDFSPQTVEEFVEQRMNASPFEATFGVERGGELGGLITVQPLNEYLASAHCLFKQSFWGSDVTLAACRQVFQELFENTSIQKISSIAFADNHQILTLVRKLGGDKEGHLYRNTLRNGKPADQMVLAIQKQDFLDSLKPEVTQ